MNISNSLQGGRNPYVPMCLNITNFREQLICFSRTSAAWFIWQWLHFTIVNSMQKRCENLPGRLTIETVRQLIVIHCEEDSNPTA